MGTAASGTKFNEHHDAAGRFASGGSGGAGSSVSVTDHIGNEETASAAKYASHLVDQYQNDVKEIVFSDSPGYRNQATYDGSNDRLTIGRQDTWDDMAVVAQARADEFRPGSRSNLEAQSIADAILTNPASLASEHSQYLFQNRYEAVLTHELGHGASRIVGPDPKYTWAEMRKHAPTEQAKLSPDECLAEIYTFAVSGHASRLDAYARAFADEWLGQLRRPKVKMASAYLVLRNGHLVGIGLPADVARAYLRPELLAGVKMNEHHDERGRFASGGSGGTGDAGLSAQLRAVESQIAGDKVEHAIALDSDGQVLLRKKGREADVGFTADEIDSLRDTVLTHNHPHGSGLNIRDVNFAMRADVRQVRAVTRSDAYSLDRPSSGWPVSPEARASVVGAYNRAERNQYDVFDRLINDGRMTPRQARLEHHHEVMTHLAQEMGWTYKREPIS